MAREQIYIQISMEVGERENMYFTQVHTLEICM